MKFCPLFAIFSVLLFQNAAFADALHAPGPSDPAAVPVSGTATADGNDSAEMPVPISESENGEVAGLSAETPSPGQKIPPSLLETALNAAPPVRASYARALATPEKLAEIDNWIAHTSVDAPKNLILKDILTAMPPKIAGPRIVELAKKSHDSRIRASWSRWLEKYPDAYARVLVAWMHLDSTSPDRFHVLLTDYAQLRPADALSIWSQIVTAYPMHKLGMLTGFGSRRTGCAAVMTDRLDAAKDEMPRLRAIRALTACVDAAALDETRLAAALSSAREFLDAKTPSRRIAALDLIRALGRCDDGMIKSVASRYDDAKNTTERAHALDALEIIDPDKRLQNQRVEAALTKGDETLRLAAAKILAARDDGPGIAQPVLLDAFKRELWPDTQLSLYTALANTAASREDLRAFHRQVMLDDSRSSALRLAALADIAGSESAGLTFDDMAALQKQKSPDLGLIAAYAEALYEHNPAARPGLRSWLHLQQPFERRLFATFSHFVRVDARTGDPSAADTMRAVCAVDDPQEAIIRPCLDFFRQHAETGADKKTLEKLEQRKNQIDAMLNFEL